MLFGVLELFGTEAGRNQTWGRSMKAILPYPPSVNSLYRTIVRGRIAMPIKTAAYRDYEGEVRRLFLEELKEPFARDLRVAVTIHVYRPQKRGDLDNTLKALLDVLHSIAFENDDQVIEIHAYRHDDKENPRASVEIWDILETPEPGNDEWLTAQGLTQATP